MKNRNHALTLATLGMMLTLSACALTRQSRSVETTGFLKNYGELREGERGEAIGAVSERDPQRFVQLAGRIELELQRLAAAEGVEGARIGGHRRL